MFLREASRENLSLPFLLSRGCLPPLAHGPALHLHRAPSQFLARWSHSLFLSLTRILLPPSHEDCCDDTGPIHTIQAHLPISASPTESHLQSPFCHIEVICSQVQGTSHGHIRQAIVHTVEGVSSARWSQS
uniref:Uncharacterized protein n=1 Tax=Molossus molossus TaxID=27622 RepID=A0A7J8F9Z5_MOLMO|nr:hypothetical protein HJG59_008509 [Molossus molossus]